MFTTILALAFAVQAPSPAPKPAQQPQAQLQTKRDYSDVIARNRARRGARVSAGVAREQAAYIAQAKAEAEYKAALPFLLES